MEDEGNSTSSGLKSPPRKQKQKSKAKKKVISIIDRSISIEDESLMAPLEPERLLLDANTQNIYGTLEPLVSILRKGSEYDGVHAYDEVKCGGLVTFKRVSFARSDSSLLNYKEPEDLRPYEIGEPCTSEEIVTIFEASRIRNNLPEMASLKTQLKEIDCNFDRSATLNLSNVVCTFEFLEMLEDLLRVVNFRKISLSECTFTSYTSSEFFGLLEYYDSTSELNLSTSLEESDAWKYFTNFVANSYYLTAISFKCMTISDCNMKSFMAAVTKRQIINILKFDSCSLMKVPNFQLVETLDSYPHIMELHLMQTGLYTKEADCIGRLLSRNNHLQVLNVSNNVIGDRGFELLTKGLIRQPSAEGIGLSVLIIYNNQLTEKSGKNFGSIIDSCKNLRTLNIGFNHLTDDVIYEMKESLKTTTTLEGLGMQSTVLTCIGAATLAEVIEKNISLQNINLRGNQAIYIVGLEKLSKALLNTKIEQIELDATNRSSLNPGAYSELVKKISVICAANKARAEQQRADGTPNRNALDVSLKCEPYYNAPSPVPSQTFPASRTRSRFQVSKVKDSTIIKSSNTSRFKVVAVPNFVTDLNRTESLMNIDTVEEEFESIKFKNVSSVSSQDSVESFISTPMDFTETPSTPCESD